MKNIIYMYLFLLFCSCREQEFNLFVLPEETSVKGIDYPNEIFMSYPWSIDIVDDKLLLFMVKGDCVVRIVNAENGLEIKQTGQFGGGPREFVHPIYWGTDAKKNIYLYDEAKVALRTYKWEDIIEASELPLIEGMPLKNMEANILSGKIFNNNYFVGSAVIGVRKPIVVLNSDLGIHENMGNVPDEKYQSNALVTYGGTVSSYDNKFVFAMASLGYIVCYEQKSDGTSIMLWEAYSEKPIYKKDQLDLKRLKLGFSDVKMTKNYIFCSYFGQKYVRENRKNIKPRNILVFDHQGHLLKNLRSERSVGKFTVSADEKTLYAITEEPEVAVIRFDISNLMK